MFKYFFTFLFFFWRGVGAIKNLCWFGLGFLDLRVIHFFPLSQCCYLILVCYLGQITGQISRKHHLLFNLQVFRLCHCHQLVPHGCWTTVKHVQHHIHQEIKREEGFSLFQTKFKTTPFILFWFFLPVFIQRDFKKFYLSLFVFNQFTNIKSFCKN